MMPLVFTVQGLQNGWLKRLEDFTRWPVQTFKFDDSTPVVVFTPDGNIWFDVSECNKKIEKYHFIITTHKCVSVGPVCN